MAKLNCFPRLATKKRDKLQRDDVSTKADYIKALRTLQIQQVKPVGLDEANSTLSKASVPSEPEKDSLRDAKVLNQESPVEDDATEVSYEGEDEQEENASIRREISDFDLHAHANSYVEFDFRVTELGSSDSFDAKLKEEVIAAEKDVQKGGDTMKSGHVSDPGIGTAEFWASPRLKRSCSNLETRDVLRKIADQLPPSKSQSFEELQDLSTRMRADFITGSPLSVLTHGSADRVMLKKHSSSQVLPSRSRKLWWKLFLWSHRNLHKPWTAKRQPSLVNSTKNQQGGYSSDTLELNQAMKQSKMESPQSFSGESLNKVHHGNCNDNQSWKGFHSGVSELWTQNQWVAFPGESTSFTRVEEWVRGLDTQISLLANDDANTEEDINFPPSPDGGKSLAIGTVQWTRHQDINLSEEILQANNVIQSLNSSSTVAHISGIGLKAIPSISLFCSLRSVNLSNNLIVHITPGSLPKGLHSLNLSKNKINIIEGLRELTRLKVLDLSYNRISRIGHGLSNSTLIKELYLAGNKISDVEGLHRLLKLTVLDLSFNKITTTKALGQLVANYNSLQALNLLGNPIQNNISDDQLRKAVCSLLPKLVYLNKQSIKPQRAREVLTDSVAKAALGSRNGGSRRNTVRRVSQNGLISSSNRSRSSAAAGHKSRDKSKSQSRRHLPTKTLLSAQASSSH
ncbi:hypothetical protein SLEP1_g48687 [Rubroshorea leprosula]|uniref:Uncharacterized protein n=1 Tax=Rubroshorea leprosula TaxID=152421 RepID=A0AAV5LVA2_9ROSI|nr:hypothetical protein SLEP1_g48687 [Rubroshorea leprosula]